MLHVIYVSNLACLACVILKLHAKCAIKRKRTVTYSTLLEKNDWACYVHQNKAKCVRLCRSNLICAYL